MHDSTWGSIFNRRDYYRAARTRSPQLGRREEGDHEAQLTMSRLADTLHLVQGGDVLLNPQGMPDISSCYSSKLREATVSLHVLCNCPEAMVTFLRILSIK